MSNPYGIPDSARANGRTIRWSEAFTRTSGGPGVWHNRYLVRAPRMPFGGGRDSGRDSYYWQHFADGGILTGGHTGWQQTWWHQVQGYAAMRFLCAVLDIEPPTRKLKGEPFVPDPDILIRAVYAQTMEIPPDGSRHFADADRFWQRLEAAHR